MAKTWNALIYPHTPNVITERRLIDVAEIPSQKVSWWRPVVEVGNVPYDPITQKKIGPVTTIEAARVVDTWTVRDKTVEELDAEKAEVVNAIDKVQFLIAFDIENRVRALEGKAAVTAAQYRNAIKARL